MDKKNFFTVVDDQGKEVKCEVLFTFDSDETGKHYIVYTDDTTDAEGNTKVYASTFDPENEKTSLGAIESEKEWKIIETILESLQNKEEGKDEQ